MTFVQQAMPLLVLFSSLIPGLIIFTLREDQNALRTFLNLAGVCVQLVLVALMLLGVSQGLSFRLQLPFIPNADLILRADALSLQFVTLSSVLWLATTLYAIGYLKGSKQRSRFFGYFSLCVSTTVGLALAGNLVTFLLFYELLTLATFPLLVHRGTPEALKAGKIYLAYTVSGGTLILLGIVVLHTLTGSPEFTTGGYLQAFQDDHRVSLTLAFALLIAGLGVKAALFPLHGWLPRAMVAPAPVSALLHAVAVVKAGAFGIIRVVYDVFGVDLAQAFNLMPPVLWLAAFTIIFGSVMALRQTEIKKRLAYSTVSQVSYITLGVALMGPIAAIGGLVHLVHQGLMKVTLFFCAGIFAETLHVHRVQDMNGIGRRMPLTMAAFTVGSLGMMGLPPIAGFITKWYLGMGALEVGQPWVLLLLAGSGILNAMYFLPLIYRGWFGLAPAQWPEDTGIGGGTPGWRETHWMLLAPTLFTALAYSSISQIGYLLMVLGLALGTEQSISVWAGVLALYGVHHGLAKGALFMGAGLAMTVKLPRAAWVLMTLPALALAGLPLTGGAVAKTALKTGLYNSDLTLLITLLSLGSLATTLLVIRIMVLMRQASQAVADDNSMPVSYWFSWGLLALTPVLLPWLWPLFIDNRSKAFAIDALWDQMSPILLAFILYGIVSRLMAGKSLPDPGLVFSRKLSLYFKRKLQPVTGSKKPSKGSARALPTFTRWQNRADSVTLASALLATLLFLLIRWLV